MPTRGKDGKYHSKVTPMKGAKPIYFSASTLKEFNEKRQRIIREFVEGKAKEDITFVNLLNEWWTTVKEPRIERESTRYTLANTFKNHVLPAFHPSKLARAIGYADLQACVDATRGAAKSTAERTMRCLRGACSYGVSQGYLQINYAHELRLPIVTPTKPRNPLTTEQAHKIRGLAERMPSVALLYYTGMRLGEALALTWNDVDFENERIHVSKTISSRTRARESVEGHTKTEAGNRYIPMPSELAAILKPLQGDPEKTVTQSPRGHRWCESTYGQKWRREVSSVEGLEQLTPHWLRHNYAAACYMARIPVTVTMVWLGHSKIGVTMDTYTHIKKILESKNLYDDYLYKTLKKVAEKLLASESYFDFSNNI